ncbi:MAG TPA: hypothetical protein VNZ49_15035 [Bacteroidia bacterium]|jgi:hypothetical protein|nr:hypothetical protein [Bacteroidia bacterium]
MFKKIKWANILFVILFFGILGMTSLVLSKPKNSHDGTLKKAGNYFIEMKNAGKKIYAYLLDKKLKLADTKNTSGEVKLLFADSTYLYIPLQLQKDTAFTCEAPTGFYLCKITFKVAGKIISAKFENQDKFVLKK